MSWEQLKSALSRPGFWPQPGPVEIIETHISCIFLVGDRAYKLKKPVDLGFVDFSTLELRKRYCEEELRLNRRLAPDLYLGMKNITGSEEDPAWEGDNDVIDYVVEMRRFDQSDMMTVAERDNRLTAEIMDQLAELISRFHGHCPVAGADKPYGIPDRVRGPIEENFRHLSKGTVPEDWRNRLRRLQEWAVEEFKRRENDFARRKQYGCIRECHGDMHLGNMILRDGRITVFDCIEFNDNLRWIDVLSETAFCAMDVEDRGHPELARHFLNAYLEITGDYSGLTVLPFYMCYRAMVRAKVAWLRAQQEPEEKVSSLRDECEGYIALAEQYAFARSPRLILMHGVSGTGKSVGALECVRAMGAIRIRSDIERKRIAGEKGGSLNLYSDEMTRETYDRLLECAEHGLDAGFPMVLDATFLKKQERVKAAELANRLNVPWHLLELKASTGTLRSRVKQRSESRSDASDADLDVLESQLSSVEPLDESERPNAIAIDTEKPNCWKHALSAFR